MATPYITLGSHTTGGGKVISGQSSFLIEGKPIACVGDKAACPKHKCASTIVSGDNHMIVMGKPAAQHNSPLSCGCKCIGDQYLTVGDNGGGQGENHRSTSSALQDNQLQQNGLVNNFNRNNERYENYYIEQNRTDIFIKFKTILPPYDSDGKGFSVLHSLSGVISFLLNYTLTGTRLFISLSAYTDPLSRNAKVLPYATAYISRDGTQIATKKIDDTDGIWNTEKGRVPVGSAVIELPKSNLSLVTVDLKLGYFAQVNDSVGQIAPIPPTTSYSFTLTSIAKRIS